MNIDLFEIMEKIFFMEELRWVRLVLFAGIFVAYILSLGVLGRERTWKLMVRTYIAAQTFADAYWQFLLYMWCMSLKFMRYMHKMLTVFIAFLVKEGRR